MAAYDRIPLGQVCAIDPRARRAPEFDGDAQVSFVPMSAVDERAGTIARPRNRRLADVSKGYTAFEEGDILFAKITPCMENGKAALAENLTNGMGRGSTEFFVLRPQPRILPKYVYHFVRQPVFRELARRHFTGTAGQQRVAKSFMETVAIPVPPHDRQRKIVDALDLADDVRRLQTQAADCLRDFPSALFSRLFGERSDYPKRREIAALNEVATAPLRELCEVDRRTTRLNDPTVSSLPFVGMENVESDSGRLDLAAGSRIGNRKSIAFHFDERHVLYAKLRPYLNKVSTPDFTGVCSTELIPLCPRKGVDRYFLASVLRRRSTVECAVASATGARMPRTDMNVLMSVPVPSPPLDEQRRFGDVLVTMERTATKIEAASRKAAALRESLMARLLGDAG